jgi:hypothetical protein
MPENAITRIISGVNGLGLLIAVVYLIVVDRSEHVPTVVALGFAVIGMLNAALPSMLPKSKGPKVPPLPVLLVLVLVVSGCGAGAWDAPAFAAQTLRDGTQAANEIIRERRVNALRTAGGEAQARGDDVGAAIDAAAARYDAEHEQLYEAQRAAAFASRAFSGAVFAALRGELADPGELVALGRDAGLAWTALARALDSPELDFIPPEVLQFLAGGAR